MDRYYHRVIIRHCDIDCTTYLFDIGALGIEEKDDGIIAFFPQEIDRKELTESLEVLREMLKEAGDRLSFRIERLKGKDWNREWKKGIKPIFVGDRLVILAPWHRYNGDRERIVIEPGMAFGTGHHPSTEICLEVIERISKERKGSLLDIGTGTGILAIAASILGFRPVVAIDIDPTAIETARKNLTLNHAQNIRLIHASPQGIKGRFSCIAANLTAVSIMQSLEAILSLREGNSTTILSGILKGQEVALLKTLNHTGIYSVDVVEKEGWIGMVF